MGELREQLDGHELQTELAAARASEDAAQQRVAEAVAEADKLAAQVAGLGPGRLVGGRDRDALMGLGRCSLLRSLWRCL